MNQLYDPIGAGYGYLRSDDAGGAVKFQTGYRVLPPVVKADLLQDWIAALEAELGRVKRRLPEDARREFVPPHFAGKDR
jgi:hypothetical protein